MIWSTAGSFLELKQKLRIFHKRDFSSRQRDNMLKSYSGELNVTAGISLVFPTPITQEDARKYIETAWIYLRHAIPAVALTCHVASQDAQTFSFQYAVPSSATVKDWAQQTMFWMDDKSSLRDRQSFIIENHIWDGTSGEYMTRLYIGKSSDSDREYDLMYVLLSLLDCISLLNIYWIGYTQRTPMRMGEGLCRLSTVLFNAWMRLSDRTILSSQRRSYGGMK